MNIGVIGVGRLGLCFALLLDRGGYRVIGSDIREQYVKDLQSRVINTHEPGVADLLLTSDVTFTTHSQDLIQHSDVIYVMVATPSLPDGSYDISAVQRAVGDILACDVDLSGKIVVVGCTTNPGDCQQIQDRLRHRGVHVLYNPEFIAQGSILQDLAHADMVLIGGEDSAVIRRYQEIYHAIQTEQTPNIRSMSLTAAEVVKIAINCFLTTKISYANMVGQVLQRSGLEADIESALTAIGSDSRVGDKYLKYGLGFGGPCLPRDNRAFAHYAKKVGTDFPLGWVVDAFNQQHTTYLEDHLVAANHQRLPFYMRSISYKPNTDIFEESQQYVLCQRLLQRGYTVYVEQCDLIPTSLVTELDERFGQLIQFERRRDLEAQGVKFFEIPT